jgi:hypothetical protein
MKNTLLILVLLYSSFTTIGQEDAMENCFEGCWIVSYIVVHDDIKSIKFVRGLNFIDTLQNMIKADSNAFKEIGWELITFNGKEYDIVVLQTNRMEQYFENYKGDGIYLLVSTWKYENVNKRKAKSIYRAFWNYIKRNKLEHTVISMPRKEIKV